MKKGLFFPTEGAKKMDKIEKLNNNMYNKIYKNLYLFKYRVGDKFKRKLKLFIFWLREIYIK